MKWNNQQTAINRNQAQDIKEHIKRINSELKKGQRYFK